MFCFFLLSYSIPAYSGAMRLCFVFVSVVKMELPFILYLLHITLCFYAFLSCQHTGSSYRMLVPARPPILRSLDCSSIRMYINLYDPYFALYVIDTQFQDRESLPEYVHSP